jgi:hypothetical protein
MRAALQPQEWDDCKKLAAAGITIFKTKSGCISLSRKTLGKPFGKVLFQKKNEIDHEDRIQCFPNVDLARNGSIARYRFWINSGEVWEAH